ncbi:hypothetical protein Sj15T_13120 [Sphingobium sp. TA15]|nr:hypothetical protein Sj15T_13120 [Sphingobium sp. TA15]
MEEIDGTPEQIVEVGFKAGVAECGDEGVKDVGDGGGNHVAFGQRSRIGFVLKRAPAIELEFVEDMIGGR